MERKRSVTIVMRSVARSFAQNKSNACARLAPKLNIQYVHMLDTCVDMYYNV